MSDPRFDFARQPVLFGQSTQKHFSLLQVRRAGEPTRPVDSRFKASAARCGRGSVPPRTRGSAANCSALMNRARRYGFLFSVSGFKNNLRRAVLDHELSTSRRAQSETARWPASRPPARLGGAGAVPANGRLVHLAGAIESVSNSAAERARRGRRASRESASTRSRACRADRRRALVASVAQLLRAALAESFHGPVPSDRAMGSDPEAAVAATNSGDERKRAARQPDAAVASSAADTRTSCRGSVRQRADRSPGAR